MCLPRPVREKEPAAPSALSEHVLVVLGLTSETVAVAYPLHVASVWSQRTVEAVPTGPSGCGIQPWLCPCVLFGYPAGPGALQADSGFWVSSVRPEHSAGPAMGSVSAGPPGNRELGWNRAAPVGR